MASLQFVQFDEVRQDGYLLWPQFRDRVVFVATKDALVKVRVDTVTKELWVQAAGGEKHLSEWVRDRLNAAVTGEVGDERGGSAGSIPAPSEVTTSPSPVTAETCPAKDNHQAGRRCLRCQTTFPPERAFRGPDPKVKR